MFLTNWISKNIIHVLIVAGFLFLAPHLMYFSQLSISIFLKNKQKEVIPSTSSVFFRESYFTAGFVHLISFNLSVKTLANLLYITLLLWNSNNIKYMIGCNTLQK